jgi:hypothetical protein
MTRHELLDNVRHKDLRIERTFAPNRGLDRHVPACFR